MNVRTFALVLQVIGVALLIYGWQAISPFGFVGLVLIILGGVIRWTRKADRE